MRYDRTVVFIRNGEKTYNAATGNYSSSEPVRTERPASVMDTRTETMRLVYGEIREGSLTIQLQNHYGDPFDRIEYAGKTYAVDYRRRLRVKDTFIVSVVP